jgi:hypothetical protein
MFDLLVINVIIYALFIGFDLVPKIRNKDIKSLWFSIPVYLITFAVNMMINLGMELPRVNEFIKQLIITTFHMQ